MASPGEGLREMTWRAWWGKLEGWRAREQWQGWWGGHKGPGGRLWDTQDTELHSLVRNCILCIYYFILCFNSPFNKILDVLNMLIVQISVGDRR